MTTITWQDGFEGGEDLAAVYGGGNLSLGSSIVTGGRSGGHAFEGNISNIGTGIALPHDPLIIGLARLGSLGGGANISLGDVHGGLASLSIDVLGRVAVNLPALAGTPTVTAAVSDPRLNGVWRYIEWYHIVDVPGRIIVKLDGVTVIDFAGTTGPADALRGPAFCGIGGNGRLDDFYIGLPASESDFFGDYVVTGLAPAATGSVPTPGDVRVDQQYMTYANVAPKQDVRVDQQYIIVAIKNKAPSRVRPQVFGVGR